MIRRLSDLLQHEALSNVLTYARYLTQLNSIFLNVLPKDIAPHCRLLNVKGNVLIVSADSGIWATRVRMIAPELLLGLKQLPEFAGIERVICRVRPSLFGNDVAKINSRLRNINQSRLLGPETANTIKACATSVQHAGLRAALIRFSDRLSVTYRNRCKQDG